MKVRDAGIERCRTDLHLTSTGKAHYYKAVNTFPSPSFHQRAFDPLPAGLLKEHLVSARRFETTSGSFHNKKESIPELRNPIYQKAPSSRRIQYMSNTSDVLKQHHTRTFSMADRTSENTDNYHPHPISRTHIVSGIPRHKYLKAKKNKNEEFGLPSRKDDFQSTTMMDFRRYTASEQKSNGSGKENLTFWEAEGFPKVWGYGSNENRALVKGRDYKPGVKMEDAFMGGCKIISRTIVSPKRTVPVKVPNRGDKYTAKDDYARRVSPDNLLPASLFFSGGKRRRGHFSDFGGYTVESDRIGSMTS